MSCCSSQENITSLVEQALPVVKRDKELFGVQPAHVGVRWEFPHVATEAVVEDDSALNVAVHEDESGEPQRVRERPFIVVELGGQQDRRASLVLKAPAWHANDGSSRTPPGDVTGIRRAP